MSRDVVMTVADATGFAAEVEQALGVVVVTFGYAGCGPCRTLTGPLTKLAVEDGVKVVKVDVHDAPDLAVRLGVNTVPVTFFFVGGRQVLSWTGPADLHQLRAQVREALAATR